MIKPEMLDAMAETGCTVEQVIAVVKAGLGVDPAQVERNRERNRQYQQAFRDRKARKILRDLTPSEKERSPTPPKENNINPLSPPEGEADHGFDRFWDAYPRKMNRPKAKRAFNRALKDATLSEILAGLERVIPGWTDPAFTPHPAAWLSAQGWTEPVRVQPRQHARLSRKGRGSRGRAWRPELTPERRAEAIQKFLATDLWNPAWGKIPSMAEIEAAGGSP